MRASGKNLEQGKFGEWTWNDITPFTTTLSVPLQLQQSPGLQEL